MASETVSIDVKFIKGLLSTIETAQRVIADQSRGMAILGDRLSLAYSICKDVLANQQAHHAQVKAVTDIVSSSVDLFSGISGSSVELASPYANYTQYAPAFAHYVQPAPAHAPAPVPTPAPTAFAAVAASSLPAKKVTKPGNDFETVLPKRGVICKNGYCILSERSWNTIGTPLSMSERSFKRVCSDCHGIFNRKESMLSACLFCMTQHVPLSMRMLSSFNSRTGVRPEYTMHSGQNYDPSIILGPVCRFCVDTGRVEDEELLKLVTNDKLVEPFDHLHDEETYNIYKGLHKYDAELVDGLHKLTRFASFDPFSTEIACRKGLSATKTNPELAVCVFCVGGIRNEDGDLIGIKPIYEQIYADSSDVGISACSTCLSNFKCQVEECDPNTFNGIFIGHGLVSNLRTFMYDKQIKSSDNCTTKDHVCEILGRYRSKNSLRCMSFMCFGCCKHYLASK